MDKHFIVKWVVDQYESLKHRAIRQRQPDYRCFGKHSNVELRIRAPVFAPTDDAFAKLPAGTVDNLLKSEHKKQLGAVERTGV